MEFDANLEGTLGETLALLSILHHHPECLLPVVAVEVDIDGSIRHVLTTSLGDTRRRLQTMSGSIVQVLYPIELIRSQFNEAVFIEAF